MTKQNPPFRAEHIGSLLRPHEVKDAAKAYRKGNISRDAYFETLDREIARAVKLQESVGLRTITDGEFGRSSWFGFFFERLEGLTLRPSLFRFHDEHGHDYAWQTCYASGKMRREQPICSDEFERLQGLTRETPKANMPSPSAFHFFEVTNAGMKRSIPTLKNGGTIWYKSIKRKFGLCPRRVATTYRWMKCPWLCSVTATSGSKLLTGDKIPMI